MISLGVVIVAYQVYALVLTPRLEPSVPTLAGRSATEEEWQGGRLAVARYQQLIRSYFPQGHWTQQGAPIFVEYGPMLLALGDYKPDDRGRVELKQCAVVAFPTPRQEGEPPPRDAIVIEAPGGATLQFDEKFDPMGGSIGRPVAGVLPGEIVIRSDMRESGPEDDLRVVTRNLRFNQALLHTTAEVSVRLGRHSGGGRGLEVRFLQEQHLGELDGPLPVAGASSLEVREGVWAELELGDRYRQARGPMRLTSAGPFRFDFTRFIASFQQDVRADQPNTTGPDDTLRCNELRLHFAEEGETKVLSQDDEPEIAKAQGRTLGRLDPYLLEAIGSGVRLDSPTREVAIRGKWLRLWLAEQRVRIEGAPATLAHGVSEVRSNWIDYKSPVGESAAAIGEMLVAGPGWVRLVPDRDQPEKTFEAKWGAVAEGKPAVALRRDASGQPVMLIEGRPETAAAGLGRLTSDRLSVRLREVAPDGPAGPAIELSNLGDRNGKTQTSAVLLHQVDAIGRVELSGREVGGRFNRVTAKFHPRVEQEVGPLIGGSDPFKSRRGSAERRFEVSARELLVDIDLVGRKARPTGLVCSGKVDLRQPTGRDGERPFRVLGEQLRIERLERNGERRLTVAGSESGGASAREGLAEVQAGGVRLWARDLRLDQAQGRLWTEGPGNARVNLAESRSKLGPLGSEATLRWSNGLEFNGERITLSGDVFAEAASDVLRCRRLTASLATPIDLRSGGSTEGVDLAQVECAGGVFIDHRSIDPQGQTSHERAKLEQLAVNRLTGEISGQGPGWVRSVHLGDSTGGFGIGQQQDKAAAGLRFLRVDFQQGLGGNLDRRSLRFFENVRAIYGPVLAWDHELPIHSPNGVPPDAVELSCDELRVYEDPAAVSQRRVAGAKLGKIELRALGSVRIDAAASGKGGAMTAEAAEVNYSQASDRFTLAGDGQRLGTVWLQVDPTQPVTPTSFQRLTYYRNQNHLIVNDLRGIEYRPAGPPQSAARPGGRAR